MGTRPKLRRYVFAITTAVAMAALGLVAVVPLTAHAATPITGAHPYFMPWKLGTPLPTVPAGYSLEALPSQQSMKGIQPNTTLHMTPVTLPASSTPAATAAASAAATTALASDANLAGYVNLEIVPHIGCTGIVFLHNDGSFVDAVARSYSTFDYDYQAFVYGKGQSSSIQAGISTSNGSGSFSVDGSVSDSTDDAQIFPNQGGRSFNYWRSFFEWGRFYQSCPPDLQYWYAYPYQWNGGDSIYHPGGAPGTPHCVTELKNGGYTKNSTTASSVSVAFNDTAVGFEGSSQTGYTTTASIGYHFTESGLLCGQNGYPPDSPGVMNAAP